MLSCRRSWKEPGAARTEEVKARTRAAAVEVKRILADLDADINRK